MANRKSDRILGIPTTVWIFLGCFVFYALVKRLFR